MKEMTNAGCYNDTRGNDDAGSLTLRRRKSFKELTFTDDYMFCLVLESDPELCRRLVELLLDIQVDHIEYVEPQHMISNYPDKKSVRLDVYIKDDKGTVVDLEIQTGNRPELPRRSRFYQSMIDKSHLSAGRRYTELPDSYVVFICTFDLFGYGYHKYVFRSLCENDPSIRLNDGAVRVFINARSKEEGMPADMRAFLDYLSGRAPESDLTQEIDSSVAKLKADAGKEDGYMLLEDMLIEERTEGREEGLAEGIKAIVEVYRNELQMDDPAIINKIMQKFGLSEADASAYVAGL